MTIFTRALSLVGVTVATAFFAQALPDPVSPDPNGVRPIEAADLVYMEEMTWMRALGTAVHG